MSQSAAPADDRIAVVAPRGRDGELIARTLTAAGLQAQRYREIPEVARELRSGMAAVLLADEVLDAAAVSQLGEGVTGQPAWSDLPFVILTHATDPDALTARMEHLIGVLGNVTFVERPVRPSTLVVAMRAALRARHRQYQARAVLELQQRLVGILGHDLRNPLAAMVTSADVLRRDRALTESQRRGVERIAKSGHRMSRIIRDILDYSQARTGGGIPIHAEPSDLHSICRIVVEEQEATHPDRALLYEVEGDGLGVWDVSRLQQAISNLISNAFQYSPAGTPVKLSWSGAGREKIVCVHNQGPPIPPALHAQLFDAFNRGSAGAASSGNLGLGLFIVKEIVAAHGGTVEVDSVEGQGTTFRLRLPSHPPTRA